MTMSGNNSIAETPYTSGEVRCEDEDIAHYTTGIKQAICGINKNGGS